MCVSSATVFAELWSAAEFNPAVKATCLVSPSGKAITALQAHQPFYRMQKPQDLCHAMQGSVKHPTCVQEANGGAAEPIHFRHAAAEDTQLPDSSQDLVSACLLFHELPQSAAQSIVQEAFRILRPGGALAIMV